MGESAPSMPGMPYRSSSYRICRRRLELGSCNHQKVAWQNSKLGKLTFESTLRLSNIAMEHPPFEDVFPIQDGDFSLLCLFTGGYMLNLNTVFVLILWTSKAVLNRCLYLVDHPFLEGQDLLRLPVWVRTLTKRLFFCSGKNYPKFLAKTLQSVTLSFLKGLDFSSNHHHIIHSQRWYNMSQTKQSPRTSIAFQHSYCWGTKSCTTWNG